MNIKSRAKKKYDSRAISLGEDGSIRARNINSVAVAVRDISNQVHRRQQDSVYFFGLSKSNIEKWKLGDNNICKCITKSHQIRKAVFTETDFNILYDANKPVHCLDVKDYEKQEIREYIKEGENLGYHKRYLTRTRKTWYKIENRKPAPILFGVFNRGRLKVIRNFTAAINFTCFHSFYPNMFSQKIVNKLFVYLLSDKGQQIIKINKRSYGDELDKFEPGDLNDSLCPSQKQFEMIDDEDAKRAIELAKTDEEATIQMCNNLVEKIMNTKQVAATKSNFAVAPKCN